MKVAWDQACSVSIGSVELLNVFKDESGLIRSWFRKITLVITGERVEMGRDWVLGLQTPMPTKGRQGI